MQNGEIVVQHIRFLAVLILSIFIASVLAPIIAAAQDAYVYVQKIKVMRIVEDQPAIQSLEAGQTQARLFSLRDPETVKKLEAKGFKVIAPLSGLVDILVNPVKCRDGSFNPFTIPEVRYALNFIIDREEVASKIYRGRAVPAIIPYAEPDPDYVMLLPIAAKYEVEFAKGFEYGKKLIFEAMKKAGAEFRDGKWYYNGKPVIVKFVIRIEDERKQVGEYLARKLEELGFTVEKLYKDFRGAFDIVYGGDPGKCEWHLYTEGWGFTGMTKYDHDTAVAFFSSLYGYLPGWGEAGYVNYKPPKEIDDTALKLVKGEYKSVEEYWELYRKLVDLGIRDSVRVFVAWTKDYYIVDPNIVDIIESPKAAPWLVWTYMTMKYVKPEVKFSNRYVYSPGWPWNPVGGFQDFYSVVSVANAIYLPAITSKPTTGEPGWSLFATWKVERGPMTVPEDAITWDPEKHEWVSAGGLVARNKVVINYKLLGKLKFHDGTTETVADLLASIYLIKEWATQAGKNDTKYESALASQYMSFLENFVAIRIVNETTVEVYTNFSHIDPAIIAQQADIWTGTPLELYFAMEKLVESGEAVFTISASKASGKPAVHLVSKEQCEKMAKFIREALAKRELPKWVEGLVELGLITPEEFYQRLENLLKFYEKYGHMMIGNGPFMVESYDAANDIVTLVRVKDYPISPDIVYKQLRKHVAKIKSLVAEELVEAVPGAKVATVEVEVDGKPATRDSAVPYAMLISEEGKVYMLKVGYVAPGTFETTLPEALPEGSYKLVVYVYPAGYNLPVKAISSVELVTPTTPTTTTPIVTPTITTTVTVTKTITVTKTVAQKTVAKPTTITTTVTKTETVTVGAEGAMVIGAVAAIIALLVGLAIGFVIAKKKAA
ncbi:MAG TPA: hypothetical protein EYH08_04110 [Pyrodictium sp.]|nr:hypothetical protein [Pyrodictium sp.]